MEGYTVPRVIVSSRRLQGRCSPWTGVVRASGLIALGLGTSVHAEKTMAFLLTTAIVAIYCVDALYRTRAGLYRTDFVFANNRLTRD
jgi:hypothetical protein